MKKKIIVILSLLLFTTGCGKETSVEISTEKVEVIENTEEINPIEKVIEITEEEIEEEPEIYNLSLLAVGDNLYHSTVYKKGYIDGTYKFDFVYENISDLVKEYDIAVVNQETVLVEDNSNISSYPCFGTPIQVGDALINAGFNVMLGATNHSYDKKELGVLNTIDYWELHPDITYLGLHDNEEDYNTVTIIERNNIKIAMLNYTYGLNGFIIPDDKYYLVDTLYETEKIRQDLEYAENNADITIVFPHWGSEYVYNETTDQQNWAKFFTGYGADLIIGSHPHVCEPVKYIISDNGNKSLCYYSLGNFVSGQNEKPRILGGIATLNIVKTIDKENITIEILDENFIPCVTHYNSNEHTIFLLKDYTDELANNSRMKATPRYLWDLWMQINETTEINYEKEF